MNYFLCVIGMAIIIEGLPYFLYPEKMKLIIRTILDMKDSSLRKIGLFVIFFGLLLIFLGKI